jgi:acyl-CoA synthetase (AMP-forming)/AMP-acid ligase II
MPSIPDTLRTTAARCPDREALVFGGRRRTYSELYQEVERTAAALAARGIAAGDRVLLMSPNSDAFVIAAYAVLRTGALLVPANPRNAPPEVAHLVTDSGAAALLYAPELGEVVTAAVKQSGASLLLLPLPALAELAAGDHPSVAHVPAEADDALLLYTSGTTGAAKGALFDHHRIYSGPEDVRARPDAIGVPHPDYGESILAVIVPADGTELTVESLREWSRDRIADYKAPHAFVAHPIPRNPSGKIQKHLLRAELIPR